jgi:hypothetical protein
VISPFELQIVTIVNSKPHKLFDSLIFSFDGATICSPGFNSNGTTLCGHYVLENPLVRKNYQI